MPPSVRGRPAAGLRQVDQVDVEGLTFRPATPARWQDIEMLFGERGACGGCWCMFWRLPRSQWQAGKPRNGAGNKLAFKRLVASNEQPGVIAYWRGQPVGWCALAPRGDYPGLGRSRVLRPLDDRPVWSITCLFVLKPYRRQGISVRLLVAAAEFAARKGAEVVEGYPTEPTMERTPDPFLYLGTPSAFRRAGFREVARRSKTRPIMRRELADLRGGHADRRSGGADLRSGGANLRRPTGGAQANRRVGLGRRPASERP